MAVLLPAQFRLLQSTSVQQDTGVAVDKTDDGATAVRDLYPRPYYEIKAQFGPLPQAQEAALRAFLWANRMNEIEVAVFGGRFACRITGAPATSYTGGRYGGVSVGLRGYAL